MQADTVLSDLKKIVQAIDIDTEGKISYQGDLQPELNAPDATVEAKLTYQLGDLIYFRAYAGWNRARNGKMLKQVEPDHRFTGRLRSANSTRERFDHGWRVQEIERDGGILIRKGASKRYTYPGDFLREGNNMGALQTGESIRLLNRHELLEERTNGFFYIFGDTVLDLNIESNVRLYFNLRAESAHQLIAYLSENLNHWQVPFQFKCLQHPHMYDRRDAGVLYFGKQYFSIVMEVIAAGWSTLKNYLKEEVPLFTRKLTGGISFAESPVDTSESFGTSRCKIIAQGIVAAWKQEQSKESWLNYILRHIEDNYLRLEAMYLNPHSVYPYSFPNF
ncbi:T3SS effector HopA1 family protein [Flavilitoribacter nigricans]|uniref:Uncharacterized protein n=1 Tax=Flavilitoribacter nigricans (strain ATCC 23147 / DSM 23189 / NBRC 102662 / NCIMB 1420 / SS-2) TaxID=1122177 RepID=A0A2D0MX36_FLAN2|nr:T3SS effector HopA1 family protein [Flavilitoribacter nigricans]PHN00831.1 hypothetical protein CRP01_40305 [Flavilitoribacter nigricans DSM 23189 = NBRC 102662]